MFIQLKKITEVTKKDTFGNKILNPTDDSELKEDRVVDEAIDVFSIKSIRPFNKNGRSHNDVEGQICVIYFKGGDSKQTSMIHVVSDYTKLVNEVNELKSKHS